MTFFPVVVHQIRAEEGNIYFDFFKRNKIFRKAIMKVVYGYWRGEKSLDRKIFDFEFRRISLIQEQQ